jgi:hypothetical protein
MQIGDFTESRRDLNFDATTSLAGASDSRFPKFLTDFQYAFFFVSSGNVEPKFFATDDVGAFIINEERPGHSNTTVSGRLAAVPYSVASRNLRQGARHETPFSQLVLTKDTISTRGEMVADSSSSPRMDISQ